MTSTQANKGRNMNTRFTVTAAALAACATLLRASLQATPVTDWHTFKASPATTLAGQGTNSPVLGSTSVSAAAAFLVGYFGPLALTNEGDRITLTFDARFNDAVGMGSAGDQFRFGLYDINASAKATADNTASAGVAGQTDNWNGYRFGVRSGTGTGSTGSIRERGTGADLNPMANAQTTLLGSPTGDQLLWSGAVNGAGGALYSGALMLERTPAGVALAGHFFGNGTTNLFAANDNDPVWPVNYSVVAFLNGGSLNCDQVLLDNVTVQYGLSNALQITSAPAGRTVFAGQPVTFRVAWSGSGIIPSIQWLENGFDIFGATSASYTIPSAALYQNTYTYSARISNVFGDSVTSAAATLTVLEDTNPPVVLSASSLVSNSLNVIFSEPVDPVTSQDWNNYTLSGHTISSVSLLGDTNVQIIVEPPIGADYLLGIQNVKDIAGNTVAATNVAGVAHGFQDSVMIGISDGLGFALNNKLVGHAGGDSIFDASDHFQFIYRPVSGDFDMAVRVESLLNTDLNARAGLMARPDTFFDSRNVLMEATPTRFIFQYRTNSAEATLAVNPPRPPTTYPDCWIRLVRSGSVFTGYSSTNHGVWTLIASHDTSMGTAGAYPNDILLGLAISSGNPNLVTRAQFSDFGPAVVLVPPTLAVAPSGSDLEVSWGTASIGFTLQATPSLATPIIWTNVPNSSVTNRVFVPAASSASFFRAIYQP